MKKYRNIIVLLPLILLFTPWVNAADGGVENLRQTGKAFASVAKAVSLSEIFIQVEGSAPAQEALQFPSPFEASSTTMLRLRLGTASASPQ